MAEDNDSGQDKTEEPTGRRIEKSREEGQVPRSKELNTTLLLMVGSLGLLNLGPRIVESLVNIMKDSFTFTP